MDLNQASQAHAEWKVKFRTAMTKKEQLDAPSIAADNACALGKWLHGDGRKAHGTLAAHADCLAKHRAFHVEAGKVARAINAGQYAEAEKMLGGGTPYAAASTAVGGAILGLKKAAGV